MDWVSWPPGAGSPASMQIASENTPSQGSSVGLRIPLDRRSGKGGREVRGLSSAGPWGAGLTA